MLDKTFPISSTTLSLLIDIFRSADLTWFLTAWLNQASNRLERKGFFDLIFHYSNFLGSGPEGAGSSRSQSQAIEDQSDVSSKGSDSTTRQQASAIASSSSMMEETTNENDLQV